MKLCSPEGMNPVLLTSPSSMVDLQNPAGDSRSVLFQLVGGCSEMCGCSNVHTRRLTLRLTVEQVRSQEQRPKGSRVPGRWPPPSSPCPPNSARKPTPPLLRHRSFAGDRRCQSTRGWRRCSSKCTGGSHDQIRNHRKSVAAAASWITSFT